MLISSDTLRYVVKEWNRGDQITQGTSGRGGEKVSHLGQVVEGEPIMTY